jgi:hypothetical protein
VATAWHALHQRLARRSRLPGSAAAALKGKPSHSPMVSTHAILQLLVDNHGPPDFQILSFRDPGSSAVRQTSTSARGRRGECGGREPRPTLTGSCGEAAAAEPPGGSHRGLSTARAAAMFDGFFDRLERLQRSSRSASIGIPISLHSVFTAVHEAEVATDHHETRGLAATPA